MERVTYRIPSEQLEKVEDLVDSGEFPSKSEALRTAVREWLNERGAELGHPPWYDR